MRETHLFISYSRHDIEEATQLVKSLRELGFEVWQDISGDRYGIPYSTKWFEAIEDAIYSADGAVIIDTEHWRYSNPCLNEFEMIESCDLPYFKAQPSDVRNDLDGLITAILQWIELSVDTEENRDRSFLVSRAFRFARRGERSILVSQVKGIRRTAKTLKKLRDIAGVTIERLSDETERYVNSYIAFVRRNLIIRRILISTATVLGVLCIIFFWLPCSMILSLNDTSLDNAASSMGIAIILDESARNPASALHMVGEVSVGSPLDREGEDPEESYQNLLCLSSELLFENYPVDFYEHDSQEAKQAKSLPVAEPKNLHVSYGDRDGRVLIEDIGRGVTEQIVVNGSPSCWIADDSESHIVIAAGSYVYYYDLCSYSSPAILCDNYETIESLRLDAGNVYAITENGNVVVWEKPLANAAIDSSGISPSRACVTAADDGGPLAAWFSEDKVIVNHSGDITEFDVPRPISRSDSKIAISAGVDKIAFTSSADENGCWLTVIDLKTGDYELDLHLRTGIADMAYKADGSYIVCAYSGDTGSVEDTGIAVIRTEDGYIAESRPTGVRGSAVAFYRDGYIAIDQQGRVTVFDSELIPVGTTLALEGYSSRPQSVAISEDLGVIFLASPVGEFEGSGYSLSLDDGSVEAFRLTAQSELLPNSAVALSGNGDFAAFGYPDGFIRIWNLETNDMVFCRRLLSGQIKAMAISGGDEYLVCVGASGMISLVNVKGLFEDYRPDDSTMTLLQYMFRCNQQDEKLQEIGLGADSFRNVVSYDNPVPYSICITKN